MLKSKGLTRALGADSFGPLNRRLNDHRPIGDGRRPGHGEYARVFDREFHLQPRSVGIGIDWPTTVERRKDLKGKSRDIEARTHVGPEVLFLGLLRGCA